MVFSDGLLVGEAGSHAALVAPKRLATQGAGVHQHDGQEWRSPAPSLLSISFEELRFILSLWLPEVWP